MKAEGFSRASIAEASMVGRKKVDKDVERGRLIVGDLVSVACYVVMGRMGAGCLGMVRGTRNLPAEKVELPVAASEWSTFEDEAMGGMVRTFGKTREQAEKVILGMRDEVGVKILHEGHREELGL